MRAVEVTSNARRAANRREHQEEEVRLRLSYLRDELRAGRLSYGELSELQDFAAQGKISPDDVELLEAAGVPEFRHD